MIKGNSNKGLNKASKNKKDEFYTQLSDIEKEIEIEQEPEAVNPDDYNYCCPECKELFNELKNGCCPECNEELE